jgi:hypothetical protein
MHYSFSSSFVLSMNHVMFAGVVLLPIYIQMFSLRTFIW